MFKFVKDLWGGSFAELKNFAREVFAIGVAHNVMGGGGEAQGNSTTTAKPAKKTEITANWLFKLFGGTFFNTDEAALGNASIEVTTVERDIFSQRLASLDPTGQNKPNNPCAQHVRDIICLLPSEARSLFIAMIARMPEDVWQRYAEATGIGTEPWLAWARRMILENCPVALQRLLDADVVVAQYVQIANNALDTLTATTQQKRQALQAKIQQREANTSWLRRVLMLFGFSPAKL